jgi:hypothetical protein
MNIEDTFNDISLFLFSKYSILMELLFYNPFGIPIDRNSLIKDYDDYRVYSDMLLKNHFKEKY